MSYNEKLCGISYKLDLNTDEDKLEYLRSVKGNEEYDKVIEKYGEDDIGGIFYELCSGDKNKKCVWQLMTDYNNDLAVVYIMDSGESFGDINFSVTLDLMYETPKELIELGFEKEENGIDPKRLKAFAIDWYNGAECALIF